MAGSLASALNRLAQTDSMFPTMKQTPASSDKTPAFGTPPSSLADQLSGVTKPMSSGTAKLPTSMMAPTGGATGSLAQKNWSLASGFGQATQKETSPSAKWYQTAGQAPLSTGFSPAWGGGDISGITSSPLARWMRGEGVTPPAMTQSGGTGGGGMASLGGDWAKVDALNEYIQAASAKTGVDANLIKAVMKLESNGEFIISHAGAIGYMQVVPRYWGHLGFNLYDPAENILAGATVLKHYLDTNQGDVYEALRGYHGYGFDGFTTDRQYADVIMGNLQQLQAATGGSTAGYTGTGAAWSVMFGGTTPNITQEMGLNSWSQQHLNGMYSYGPAYGITGHAGIDVGLTYGSSVYAPTGGVVIRAGGTGYYCDDSGCGPGQGELRIQLDNGDQLIIGHMSNISLQAGQRVNAGMFVGRSGSAGSGAHVHIEYRTPSSTTQSGWKVVDPRQALSGVVTATGGGAAGQQMSGLQSWMRRSMGIG